jgi:hypothetical protein
MGSTSELIVAERELSIDHCIHPVRYDSISRYAVLALSRAKMLYLAWLLYEIH